MGLWLDQLEDPDTFNRIRNQRRSALNLLSQIFQNSLNGLL